MATRLLCVCLLSAVLAGCVGHGVLVTDVTQPLMTDFDETPVGSKECVVDTHFVREPFFGTSVEWTEDTIKPMAKRAGITEIRHADLHTFSILGMYRRRTVIVYGD